MNTFVIKQLVKLVTTIRNDVPVLGFVTMPQEAFFKGICTQKCICRPGSTRTHCGTSQHSPRPPSCIGGGEGEGSEERERKERAGREEKWRGKDGLGGRRGE